MAPLASTLPHGGLDLPQLPEEHVALSLELIDAGREQFLLVRRALFDVLEHAGQLVLLAELDPGVLELELEVRVLRLEEVGAVAGRERGLGAGTAGISSSPVERATRSWSPVRGRNKGVACIEAYVHRVVDGALRNA